MPVRRKSSPARRRPATRRRRTMGQAMSPASVKAAFNTTLMGAAGGAAAALLTNVIGDNLGEKFKPYTGLVGSFATSVFLKQPVLAAGMAGYAGAKVAAELTGSDLLEDNGGMFLPNGSSMYLQGYNTPGMAGDNIYASNYTLSGYEVPGL